MFLENVENVQNVHQIEMEISWQRFSVHPLCIGCWVHSIGKSIVINYNPISRKHPAGDTLCPMDYSYDLDTEDSGHFILVSKQFWYLTPLHQLRVASNLAHRFTGKVFYHFHPHFRLSSSMSNSRHLKSICQIHVGLSENNLPRSSHGLIISFPIGSIIFGIPHVDGWLQQVTYITLGIPLPHWWVPNGQMVRHDHGVLIYIYLVVVATQWPLGVLNSLSCHLGSFGIFCQKPPGHKKEEETRSRLQKHYDWMKNNMFTRLTSYMLNKLRWS